MSSILALDTPCPGIAAHHYHQWKPTEWQDVSRFANQSPALCTSVLASPSRLQEIFDLRLEVWEHSGNTEFVNRLLFPNGWYDELDSKALHWVTTSPEGKIVAAARLNLFPSLEVFPYYRSVRHLPFPPAGAFAFFSRLVVHPQYRRMGLSERLYFERKRFCLDNGITWSQVFINNPRVINLFESDGYVNIGEAEVNYHTDSKSHSVNVFINGNLLG